jgi:hypothetical protein
MTNEKPKFNRGRQRDILAYLFSLREGKHVTISELEKHFQNSYTRNQIMATMANVTGRSKERYGLPIVKITQGVWRTELGNIPQTLPLGNTVQEQLKQHGVTTQAEIDFDPRPMAERNGFVDYGTPGTEVIMGGINRDSQSLMNDIRDAVGPVEPYEPEKGTIALKARNKKLYVNIGQGWEQMEIEQFIGHIRFAVRIS